MTGCDDQPAAVIKEGKPFRRGVKCGHCDEYMNQCTGNRLGDFFFFLIVVLIPTCTAKKHSLTMVLNHWPVDRLSINWRNAVISHGLGLVVGVWINIT